MRFRPPESRDARWNVARLFVTVFLAAGMPVVAAAAGSGSPVRGYDVELRPSWSEVYVAGRARIDFDEAASAGWPVRIPRHDLVVERISLDGAASEAVVDSLWLEIPRCRSAEVVYSARPRAGLVFAGKTLHTVFSTSHWMPCLEEPSVRASLALTLILPDSVEAVANGRLVSRAALPAAAGADSLVAWRFELDAPYPSYLYGFAAGPMVIETARCGDVELVAAGDGVAPEALRRLLDETAKMMTFLAERAGVPYPLASYTQVVVPGGAAQEMAGFSVLGIDGLQEMLADAPDSAAGPVEDWLPVHELSHAWWGNAITCRDWSHFWLNEGFAVFMTAAWKQQRWGEAGYQVELERAQARLARAREAGADHPLAYAGDYPSRGLRNAIVYSKAALFLAELRRELGDDLFWRGVRAYTRSCLGRSVVSADFEQAMVGATQRDLRPLFAGWVDAPASAP
jgi:aminopeptidase N